MRDHHGKEKRLSWGLLCYAVLHLALGSSLVVVGLRSLPGWSSSAILGGGIQMIFWGWLLVMFASEKTMEDGTGPTDLALPPSSPTWLRSLNDAHLPDEPVPSSGENPTSGR